MNGTEIRTIRNHQSRDRVKRDFTPPGNRVARFLASLPDILKFCTLILITLFVTYYLGGSFRIIWYLSLLPAYYFSKNEALWLAFFLSTTDGFAGFFGLYAVTMPVLPGLPAVELTQIYVVLSVVKAALHKKRVEIFYNKYLQVLLIYLVFMIIWGHMMGFSGGLNVYFRVLKGFIPMLLFYSMPRLFMNQDDWFRFFRIVFFIALVAFVAQVFTLLTGLTPMEAAGIGPGEEQEESKDFRFFFNSSSTLIAYFAALFVLNKRSTIFRTPLLPYAVIFSILAMTVLSATRGWMISFSLVLLFTLLFTGMIRTRRFLEFVLISVPLLYLALSNPVINRQINFARERLGKIEAIAEGDLTAEGSLQRLDYRSQRVMGAWRENPVFGWGLSDKGYEFSDGHVGNQSLLAVSGIIGFLLLNGFLVFFGYRLLIVYSRSVRSIPDRNSLLVFIIFLAGWFIIHSTSGQQFNYFGMPVNIIPQAVIFSFGAFEYRRSLIMIHGKRI